MSLAHSWRLQCRSHGCESSEKALAALQSRSKEGECWHSADIFLIIQSKAQDQEIELATFKVDLHASLNPIYIITAKFTQNFISWLILHLVTLTVNINSHKLCTCPCVEGVVTKSHTQFLSGWIISVKWLICGLSPISGICVICYFSKPLLSHMYDTHLSYMTNYT